MIIYYAILALVVLGPLLKPGYVLTLDMVFGPHFKVPAVSDNGYVFDQALRLLNVVLPGDVIEKLLLFGIFVMAGVGAHKLLRYTETRWWGAAFAGTLYVINPFTYSRLMGGQYLVLAGYALLPWFVMALDRVIVKPNLSGAIKAALWAVAVSIVSIHAVLFMVLLDVCIRASAALVSKVRANWRGWARYGAVSFVVFVVASSYWLVPLVNGSSSNAQVITNIGTQDTAAYRTDGGELGLPWNVFGLSGFWGDRQHRYVVPGDRLHIWPGVIALLGVLAVIGAIWCIRKRDYLGIGLIIAGLVAAVLALGDAYGPVAPLYGWMVAHVPLYKGYREPEKWVSVIALAYAYLGGKAVGLVQQAATVPRFGIIPLVLLPILTAPTMIWAAGGQLKAVSYPAGWYQVNEYVMKHEGTSLFLPWHQYMNFGFPGRVTANLAPVFFKAPVVAGDNPEIAADETASANSRFALRQLIPAGERGENVAPMLRAKGYRYIIFDHVADYRNYGWLEHQPNLHRVEQGSGLTVYEVSGG